MARITGQNRRLPANVKAIQKAVKASADGRPGATEFRIDGVRGLVLHVLPSGTATWYLHYDVVVGSSRKRRKLKIGRLDEITLADAIAETERLRPQIRQGGDPVARRNTDREALTFGALVRDRLERGDPLRPGTRRDYEWVLNRDILPELGSLPAQSITRDHVLSVIDAISKRGATRRADTARAVISGIFAYGIDRGLVPNNPAVGIRNRHDYQPRDVVAGPGDIRLLWQAMDDGTAAMSQTVDTIVRLALLTGLRRTEVAAVRMDELDLNSDRPMLTIRRGRAKNRNAHRVPLSPQAVSLFKRAVEAAGNSLFVFPGLDDRTHVGSRSVSKALERTRVKLRMQDITMHDLRRTAGTYMSQLGVPRDVRERILNHGGRRKGSVTDGVYNHYEYDAEKRAALELWADALDGIISGMPTEIDSYTLRLSRIKGSDKVRIN